MPTAVWSLRWVDVEPATHSYDEAVARVLVEPLLSPTPQNDSEKQRVEAQVDRALMAEFGYWVAGWTWAASEPGGGGPVSEYCCAVHSIKGSSAEILAVVLAAVRCWRGRLTELDERFSTLREESAALEIDDAVSRSATNLLPLVLEWTGAADAWYSTYQRVVAWYVESLLGDSDRLLTLVEGAIGGRFESWIAPTQELADQVSRDIGATVAADSETPLEGSDMLARWILEREKIHWSRERRCAPEPVSRDGHVRFINTVDAVRDPERGRRMRAALRRVRIAARDAKSLTLELLGEWQEVVLGQPVAFRQSAAFAHRGAERYGLEPRTQRRFERCLHQAMDDSLPSVARAARLYLDVCYFHPFANGNARAARLALDYVLSRDGLALHAAEPVFLVARRVGDRDGVSGLQFVVDYLAGQRQEP